jgi:16S rRNA (uracil1498-N3)-methyltransferase
MRIVIQAGSGGAGQRVSLSEDEVHHLKVRRAKEGQEVEVLDGAGLQGRGILVKGDREWMVDIEAAEVHERPRAVTLGVAAGDRDRFSWMVEKSVELGVTRIVPLESERTAGVATRLKDAHIPRLRRSVLEAIKQCGAAWAPAVENLVPKWHWMAGPPARSSGLSFTRRKPDNSHRWPRRWPDRG